MQMSSQVPSPSLEDGNWPTRRRSVLDWLIIETRNERFIDNILVEMCERLQAAGVPVARATLHFRINHPQWLGARILWRKGLAEAEIDLYDYGTQNTALYLNSPLYVINNGGAEVRTNLQALPEEHAQNSLYVDLKAEGLTEYIAWPLEHTLGKRHVVTFTTDRKGGFEDEHVAFLSDLLPALALVSEIRLKNRFVRTLLETYVGPHASEQILAGATTRGSGVTVGAAILICDLRNFTKLSDLWPRDDVIDLLNAYFDAMSEPIERHGARSSNSWAMACWQSFRSAKPMPPKICCRQSVRRKQQSPFSTRTTSKRAVNPLATGSASMSGMSCTAISVRATGWTSR